VTSPATGEDAWHPTVDDAVPEGETPFAEPGDGERVALDIVAPSTLAYATAPAVRPWRGFMVAGGLHLVVVAMALLLIRVHLPAPPPDGPVISVEVETTPPGNTPLAVTQAHVAPAAVAHPVMPVVPAVKPVQQPLPAPQAKPELRLPPVPPLPPPPPAIARPAILPPGLTQGTHVAGHRMGQAVVGATRPASPDAGSTVYYSEISRELGEQGEVRLSIVISPTGMPGHVTMEKSSGYPRLDNDARDSVLTWHFQPALKRGVPVESVLVYWVRFELK
jgi:protein TonB